MQFSGDENHIGGSAAEIRVFVRKKRAKMTLEISATEVKAEESQQQQVRLNVFLSFLYLF